MCLEPHLYAAASWAIPLLLTHLQGHRLVRET